MSTEQTSEKYPWPQWQLTAFVLNELEPDVVSQIQSAADADPALASEIAAIRSTVAGLTQLYKHETAGIEPTSFTTVTSGVGSTSTPSESSANDPVVFNRRSNFKFNWTPAVGLAAMAASLLIAVVLAAPAIQNYFTQSNDVLAKADEANRIAKAETKAQELTRALEETKSELSELLVNREDNSDALKSNSASSTSSSPEVESPTSLSISVVEELSDKSGTQFSSSARGKISGGEGKAISPSDSSQENNEGAESRERSMSRMDRAGLGDRTAAQQSVNQPRGGKLGVPAASADLESEQEATAKGESKYLEASKEMAPEVSQPIKGPVSLAQPTTGPAKGNLKALDEADHDGEHDAPSDQLAVSNPVPQLNTTFSPAPGQAYRSIEGKPLSTSNSELAYDYESADAKHEENLSKEARADSFYRRRFPVPTEPSNDRYAPIYENPFKHVESDPLTTFSIDVDTASYVKARQFLLQSHSLPPANAVRVEEFINYFEYEYAGPHGDDPFAAHLAVATCPWRSDHKLVRIALQAKKMNVSERPKANIVFLLDVSGSMDEPNKLPLVKESMRMLIQQLGENDRVAMVVYAGAAGCVLESTTGDKQDVILGALNRLNAGGSTNGGQGIQLAYDIARDHFVPGGVNRLILCTDGDFNVGTTSTEGLVNLVVENAKSKVFLTVLGFGMGNTNDAMMEQISDKGNGVYGFVDSRREAQRQMVKQLAGNLMTVAKDVKIQVEFNPERVASYRLIGYENRKLANEDFANDKKDAGEIGAGHRVTALYEIEPIGPAKVQPAEGLRYQKRRPEVKAEVAAEPEVKPSDESSNELLAVSLRYKQPEGDTSKLLTFPLVDSNKPFAEADQDFKWAASVAQFAMLLRSSAHKGNTSWSGLIESVESLATDESRRECVQMIRTAAGLSGR